MKIAELRAKSQEELKDVVLTSKKELFNLRMQKSTGELEKTHRFREVTKTIARAHTLMTENAQKSESTSADEKNNKAKKEA